MEILTLTEAKPKIGRLIDRALAGKAVLIRKGGKLVQLSKFVAPKPVPARPVGYFRRRPMDYAFANRAAPSGVAVR